MLGPERKSHIFVKKKKKYHIEGGHAIVLPFFLIPTLSIKFLIHEAAPPAILWNCRLKTRDCNHSENFWRHAVSLGGFVTENDVRWFDHRLIQRFAVATALARDMVTKYGMSENMGPMAFEELGGRAVMEEVWKVKNIQKKSALWLTMKPK